MRIIYGAVFLLMLSFHVHAFTVDSLFKVHSEKDNHLLLKNSTGRPEFINITLSDVRVEKGVIKETLFDNEDFLTWPIYASPSSVILDPGGAERISIVSVVQNNPRDRMIGISLLPDSLSSFSNSVDISIGYKSWYLIPGSEAMTGTLEASRKNANEIRVNNRTNKHLLLNFDWCAAPGAKIKDECVTSLFILAGISKDVVLNNAGKKVTIYYSDALKKQTQKIEL